MFSVVSTNVIDNNRTNLRHVTDLVLKIITSDETSKHREVIWKRSLLDSYKEHTQAERQIGTQITKQKQQYYNADPFGCNKKVTIKFEHTSQNFVQVLKIQHVDDCPS